MKGSHDSRLYKDEWKSFTLYIKFKRFRPFETEITCCNQSFYSMDDTHIHTNCIQLLLTQREFKLKFCRILVFKMFSKRFVAMIANKSHINFMQTIELLRNNASDYKSRICFTICHCYNHSRIGLLLAIFNMKNCYRSR